MMIGGGVSSTSNTGDDRSVKDSMPDKNIYNLIRNTKEYTTRIVFCPTISDPLKLTIENILEKCEFCRFYRDHDIKFALLVHENGQEETDKDLMMLYKTDECIGLN